MAKDSFVFRCDYIDKLSQFSNEDIGIIIKSIVDYVQNGETPNLEKYLMIAFNMIRVDIDKDLQRYKERCEVNKRTAIQRWEYNKSNKIKG